MSTLTARQDPPTSTVAAAVAEPGRYRTSLLDRVAYAGNASHYLRTPQAVIIAADAAEVAAVFRAARASGTPVTLRSGGTSLAGQATTDGLLIDVRRNFRNIEVLDGGRRVRVQPGLTVRQVNAHLAAHGHKLGPDPASEAAATIGGVINNNSSGMACGTEFNTYRTLESMTFVLPSGTLIDTAAPDAEEALRAQEPELVDTLLRLQLRVRDNAESVAIIERHFALKNTMGYGLNSFLDHDSPLDLLTHLIIGSEGTLAFVAEAVFRTVRISPLATTALAVFPDLDAATRVLPDLVGTGVATLELMDATSLRVGQSLPGAPSAIMGFKVGQEAALLVEYHADEQEELEHLERSGTEVLAGTRLHAAAPFSPDAVARNAAWNFRKGLYASVAGARPSGTTSLLEDIAVPVPAIAATCEALQELFSRNGYRDGVIFGHAKDGNIHYMLTDRFDTDDSLHRFHEFHEQTADLVLSAGGNLKAEHGTGHAMAPFVRRQYGDELYEVMQELKRACDPDTMLNPGVILNDDPQAHLRDLKVPEPVEEEINRCTECGYCEPVCPSRDLTLTPRQRIVVRRAQAAAQARGDHATAEELSREYDYPGEQTCAVDGMCQTACPVQINTGDFIKRRRREHHGPVSSTAWTAAAKTWGPVTRAGSTALSTASRLPTPVVRTATDLGRAVLGEDTVPRYSGDLPAGGAARKKLGGIVGDPTAEVSGVFLPSCVNSMFGAEGDGAGAGTGATQAFIRLLERAGLALRVPGNIESLCCGTPWSSKGQAAGQELMADRVRASVREVSGNGRLPVVSDAASCTEGFAAALEKEGVEVVDAVDFAVEHLLPALEVTAPVESLTLHPTCSSRRIGLDAQLGALGAAVAETVHVPVNWGCCAFAGDRGMLHPELTASATAPEAAEVGRLDAAAHASCNRTCEIGMTRATGRPYSHILELLEQATRP
ncbi:FAD-binding and (Fe-S)-binding domain-containing protein [Corynebacterium halotolerans]|uniref:D-lactate dehydrogenase (cytochrome) n=1 Tax=Corynebacterium halotolerans YIM 70093 = DSM 44683 TaxID=1121362 RepID=M1NVN1_9CORY|nr:FAD-binding and (Fe-S)-binding domain-containing protein [Corynebacterium halotolerans]AGF73522.1 FAD linked oxidase domain-containing protein [Corynebacterium halotolerans YIM 70093 = DSM 44683]